MKNCVLNVLEIVIVDFLKEIITKFEMLKERPEALVNKSVKLNKV